MKFEPSTINRQVLIQAVERDYAIDIELLDFVPLGEVACSYVVHVRGGERYFLKLYTDTRAGRMFRSRLDFYLPLCQRLRQEGVIERLPCAVTAADGALQTRVGGDVLVLFEYIDGLNVGDEPMSDTLLWQVGVIYGRLHADGAKLVREDGRVDDYGVPFNGELRQAFVDLAGIGPDQRPGRRALRQLLEPHANEVLGHLNRLLELQREVRDINPERVLCHTDLHGANLIIDDQGHLHALDWEGALLAPPEHDVKMYIDHARFADIFLPAYQRECGPLRLRHAVLDFYGYRRILEDLADWMLRILYEEQTDAQDASDLECMRDCCVVVWPYLPGGAQKTEEKLQSKGLDLFI